MTRLASLTLLLTASCAFAELRLPRIFTDRMVLQQELPIAVWGWEKPKQALRVSFNGTVINTSAAADGSWRVDFPPMVADGKSHPLEVRGENTVTLKDVVLGEVWLVSGQST